MRKFLIFIFFTLMFTHCFASDDSDDLENITPRHDNPVEPPPKAIDWQLIYIGDGLHGFSGPYAYRTVMINNLLLNLTLDAEKLFNLKGNTLFFTYLGVWGSNPNQIIGSIQGVDNIESNVRTAKLYQAYTDQKLLNDRLSILLGLYDFNSEFNVTNSSLVFIMPPMGTGTEIAQSGVNGPSVYPTTSLAARIKLNVNERWYFMFAAFDGMSGNPNHPFGTHIDVANNGLLLAYENGLNFGPDDKKVKMALGVWHYTKTSDELLSDPIKTSHNQGMYALFDIPLYRVAPGNDRGINFFLRPGIANNFVNIFSPAIGTGFYWKGPFAERSDDEAGIGLSYAKSTDDYVAANTPTALSAETLVEMTYSLKVNEYFVVQSSLEWVLPKNQSIEEPYEQRSLLGFLRVKATI